MPVKVIIQNSAAGATLRVNSIHRPDAYLFRRNPQRWSEHQLVFATAEEFNAASPDLLCATGNPPMHVLITPNATPPADPTGEIARLTAELTAARADLQRLREDVKALREAAAKATSTRPGKGAGSPA